MQRRLVHGFIRMAALLLWSAYAFSGAAAQALTGATADYDALLAMIGDARIVMLGEVTHGSREFYEERARITRHLIEQAGFGAVMLEASWEPRAAARRLHKGQPLRECSYFDATLQRVNLGLVVVVDYGCFFEVIA